MLQIGEYEFSSKFLIYRFKITCVGPNLNSNVSLADTQGFLSRISLISSGILKEFIRLVKFFILMSYNIRLSNYSVVSILLSPLSGNLACTFWVFFEVVGNVLVKRIVEVGSGHESLNGEEDSSDLEGW